jgi:hypothetical protein
VQDISVALFMIVWQVLDDVTCGTVENKWFQVVWLLLCMGRSFVLIYDIGKRVSEGQFAQTPVRRASKH